MNHSLVFPTTVVNRSRWNNSFFPTLLLLDGFLTPNLCVSLSVVNSCHFPSIRYCAFISYITSRSCFKLTGLHSAVRKDIIGSVCLTLWNDSELKSVLCLPVSWLIVFRSTTQNSLPGKSSFCTQDRLCKLFKLPFNFHSLIWLQCLGFFLFKTFYNNN